MRIVWLRSALHDLNAIEQFIELDNPAAARAMEKRIVTAVGRLATYPQLGRAGRIDGTRELVVAGTPYLVPYTVADETIVVLAVLHGARAWPEQLQRDS